MIYGSTQMPHIRVERGRARLQDHRGYTLRELSMADLNNLAVGATNALADMKRAAADCSVCAGHGATEGCYTCGRYRQEARRG